MIETLFSLFFIAVTLLLTSQLLLSAARLQREVETALSATYIAESMLAQWKAAAVPPTSGSGLVAGAPSFRYTVDVVEDGIYSPCQTVELTHPPDQRRYLEKIWCKVRVTIFWGADSTRNRVQAYGVFPKPLPVLDRLVIDADAANPSPLPPDQTAHFAVSGLSAANQPVPGLLFSWQIKPMDGNGTVRLSRRDGRQGEFKHYYNNPYIGPTYFPARQCRLEARARYRGKDFRCESDPVPLSN